MTAPLPQLPGGGGGGGPCSPLALDTCCCGWEALCSTPVSGKALYAGVCIMAGGDASDAVTGAAAVTPDAVAGESFTGLLLLGTALASSSLGCEGLTAAGALGLRLSVPASTSDSEEQLVPAASGS